jgi:hypothetical protein
MEVKFFAFAFACSFALWYNPANLPYGEETGMLLEDLKQQLDDITGRLEVLRRHL